MSSPTFPRFRELPQELQIAIFREAGNLASSASASPTAPPYDITNFTNTLFRTMIYLQYNFPVRFPNRIVTFLRLAWKLPFRTRFNLMGACLLGRQVALEQWRGDVEAAPVVVGMEYVKKILLDYFDREIAKASGRLEKN